MTEYRKFIKCQNCKEWFDATDVETILASFYETPVEATPCTKCGHCNHNDNITGIVQTKHIPVDLVEVMKQ